MRHRRWFLVMLLAAFVVGGAENAAAQDGSNVLLVVNEAAPQFDEIAAKYAAVRRLPAENVLRIKTATDDDIDRPRFDLEIAAPITKWLLSKDAQDRILYIVLVKGIPLRIRGTGGLSGTGASVDSELALLYRRMLGITVPPMGRIVNPYFHANREIAEAKPFTHETYDMYLVTRLDGFTVSDVLRIIDYGAAPVRDGVVVLDQRANILGDRSGDAWLAAAAERLTAAGFGGQVSLESSRQVVTGRKQVLGYYSWGSNDRAITMRKFNLQFVPGALAGMFVSTDGRTFTEPPESWAIGKWQEPRTFFAGSPQSLAGDLIREGATGVAAHVAEPFLDATVRPQILFPAYFAGFNLAESFYLSMPFLSWQTVIIGDPLCAPFPRHSLTSEQRAPPLDPNTELPRYFSKRRLDLFSALGARADVATLMLKANARFARGDVSGARQTFEEVTVLDPTLVGVQFILAGMYEQSGEYDFAIQRYRAILGNRPNDVPAMNNLAYALAVHKHAPQEALPIAEAVYKLASGGGLAQVADTLGWIHHLIGHEAEAEKYLTESVARAAGNATAQLHLATIQAALGRRDEALATMQLAVKLDPSLENSEDGKALRARLTAR